MTAIDLIREVLHHFAGLFIWPVLICLLALSAVTVVLLGGFAREAFERRRKVFRVRVRAMSRLDEIAANGAQGSDFDLQLEHALQELNHRRWVAFHRSRLPVRLGPSLGLMGTLIPMAAALAALSSGNLPALASNMVTAFAATVIGLVISVVNYLISSFREEWIREDARELAFHAERLLRSNSNPVEVLHGALR